MFNDLNNLSQRQLSIKKRSCVSDAGDVYKAEVELAGFCKKDLSISVTEGILEVKAENKDRSQDFKLHLNDLVSVEHITADLKHGLLQLTLPKRAVAESVKIEIK